MNKYIFLILLVIITFQQGHAVEEERDNQVCMDCNYNFKVDHGYCSKTKSCIPAKGGLEACGGWEYWHNSKSSCVSCSEFKDCGSCAEDGFCAWLDNKCVNDSQAKGIKKRISTSRRCPAEQKELDEREGQLETGVGKPMEPSATESSSPDGDNSSTNINDNNNTPVEVELVRDPSIPARIYDNNKRQCGDSQACYACLECNGRQGSFDFNVNSNKCISREYSTGHWEEWQNSLSSCVPMDKVDNCYECARDGFGAWYHNECINDSQSGKLKGKITDFNKCPPSKRL